MTLDNAAIYEILHGVIAVAISDLKARSHMQRTDARLFLAEIGMPASRIEALARSRRRNYR